MKKSIIAITVFSLFFIVIALFCSCDMDLFEDKGQKDMDEKTEALKGIWFRVSGDYTYTYIFDGPNGGYEYTEAYKGEVKSYSYGDLQLIQNTNKDSDDKVYYTYTLKLYPVGGQTITFNNINFETERRLSLGGYTYTKNNNPELI